MANCTLKIKVHVSWWVRWYLSSISIFSSLTGLTPDIEKIGKFIIKHGMKVEAL